MGVLRKGIHRDIFRSIFLAVIVPVMSASFCRGQSPAADSRSSSDRSPAPGVTITVYADQRQEMASAIQLDVPIVVDVNFGNNWLEAK